MTLPPAGPAPRLSICIPTHQGRAGALERAIDSILAQVGPGIAEGVEICISDNGSQDATRTLVAERMRRHPGVLSYHRFEVNQGFTANLLQSVERARGEFCWLFSSDDALAPGGLARLLALLAAHPDATGVTIAPLAYDFERETAAWPFYPDLLPSHPEREQRWDGAEAVVAGCGAMMGVLPSQVIRRAAWQAAVATAGGPALARVPRFPHLAILLRAALARPAWVWDPGPTYLLRTEVGNSVVDDLEGDLTRYHVETTTETVAIWRELIHDRRVVGELRRRTRRALFTPQALVHYKVQPGQRLADDARLLAACTRWFWRLPEFWPSLAILLLPHPAVRSLTWGARAIRAARHRQASPA